MSWYRTLAEYQGEGQTHHKLIIFDFDGVLIPEPVADSRVDYSMPRYIKKLKTSPDLLRINTQLTRLSSSYDLVVCSRNQQNRLDRMVPLLFGYGRFKKISGGDTDKSERVKTFGQYSTIYFLDNHPDEIREMKRLKDVTSILVPTWENRSTDFIKEPLHLTSCGLLDVLSSPPFLRLRL